MNLKQLSKEELKEMSFIEIAYALLKESREPAAFQEILSQIQEYQELSEAELKARMIQFYTDLNIDGRFITFGENRWGLRAWYPVDQLEEEAAPAVKAKKKKTKKAVKEEPDFEEELEEEEELEDDLDFEDEDLDELDEEVDSLDDLDDLEEDDEEFEEDLGEEDEYDLEDEEEEDLK
ncbi:DNA-directed RNA polymerase subunit delta [Bacillus badius]|uniref:Probable DNA-directed RNA polymerase subunit delta n=1 Tax=Bacillus badius TaxID=1455 RepID=A0ABR5AVC5_BACBA|nr:DNA-directed RNA polymerase subunit delta [Bacillus badius]KIL78698.1 DNA-directed RNA polymerase delta subunit [Bacillus badius]MED4718011.1 DNA-directed RNA polymerase subunit delta [Bacillus badius]